MLPVGSLFWECPPLEHPVYHSCSELVTVKHQSIVLCRCNWCETDAFRLVVWEHCLRILVWKILSPSERDKCVSLIVKSWNCVALDCVYAQSCKYLSVSRLEKETVHVCSVHAGMFTYDRYVHLWQVCSPATGMFTYNKLCMCAGMFTYDKRAGVHWFSLVPCENYQEFNLVGVVSFTPVFTWWFEGDVEHYNVLMLMQTNSSLLFFFYWSWVGPLQVARLYDPRANSFIHSQDFQSDMSHPSPLSLPPRPFFVFVLGGKMFYLAILTYPTKSLRSDIPIICVVLHWIQQSSTCKGWVCVGWGWWEGSVGFGVLKSNIIKSF